MVRNGEPISHRVPAKNLSGRVEWEHDFGWWWPIPVYHPCTKGMVFGAFHARGAYRESVNYERTTSRKDRIPPPAPYFLAKRYLARLPPFLADLTF